MPCYTIQTTTVSFGLNTDTTLLVKALGELGLGAIAQDKIVRFSGGGSIDTQTGVTRLPYGVELSTLKKAYSAEIVKSQARRYGWQLKQTAPFQYVITKR